MQTLRMGEAFGQALATLIQIELRRVVLWLPVLLGVGIWIYFSLAREPDAATGWIFLIPLVLLAGVWRRAMWLRVVLLASLSVSTGYALALWSAHRADAPRILFPIGESVEGRVLEISRSASGAPRLMLDRLIIYGVEPGQTPERVRLTVLGGDHREMPVPGTRVRTYATLMPTGDPVEPGAFDFRRRAFFERLGGLGLVRGAVLIVPEPQAAGLGDRMFIWLQRQRDALSRALRETLPGPQGAFAAALVVGDRSGIEEVDAEALRMSNLAHLLAISGLHMGILTGLIFSLARFGFACSAWASLNFSTKKVAAVIALLAGAAYLGLSGATIATQRAFIMVAVAFAAVLVDRPALTLRALALAAVIVLILRPISLLDAGFQMSFAATAALVSGFEFLRTRQERAQERRGSGENTWFRWIGRIVLLYVGGLIASSLLAGLATGPIAAYHFNRTAPYGLLSNMLALPVMGFVIAPAACLAAMLAPLGLEEYALRIMGLGIEQVLRTAHWVASLPGSVRMVPAAPDGVLVLIVLGGLWVCIWRGPWRLAGAVSLAVALLLWSREAKRPDILIAPGAKLVGVLTPEGRVLDHDKAQGFVAKSWLRRDGDAALQPEAAARAGIVRNGGALGADVQGWRLRAVWSKKVSPAEHVRMCADRTILVSRHLDGVDGSCIFFGKADLRRKGAIAIRFQNEKPIIQTSNDPSRKRLWSRQ
ncbi:MAG: ComEC/Rec2 family competence protein [Pseudomonadota bacterium]